MTRHKYNAKPTVLDGFRFASKAEARRYSELLLLQRSGEISELELQPPFPLVVNGVKVGTYIADFRYRCKYTDPLIVEDVKGIKTPLYRLKKKHVEAQYGITITEVTS